MDSFLDWEGHHWVFIVIPQTTASDLLVCLNCHLNISWLSHKIQKPTAPTCNENPSIGGRSAKLEWGWVLRIQVFLQVQLPAPHPNPLNINVKCIHQNLYKRQSGIGATICQKEGRRPAGSTPALVKILIRKRWPLMKNSFYQNHRHSLCTIQRQVNWWSLIRMRKS